jgi:hypothetical protein
LCQVKCLALPADPIPKRNRRLHLRSHARGIVYTNLSP